MSSKQKQTDNYKRRVKEAADILDQYLVSHNGELLLNLYLANKKSTGNSEISIQKSTILKMNSISEWC